MDRSYTQICFLFPQYHDPSYWVYDIETYPNIFTVNFYNPCTYETRIYEISTRRNDLVQLLEFLTHCQLYKFTFIGFNNTGFDYPVIHHIMKLGLSCTLADIWWKAKEIIDADWNDRFNHVIWQPKIRQLDLLKVMHFDNASKLTSLKMLECRMGMETVRDLPFPPETVLNDEEMDVLIEYNKHDILATTWFFWEIQTEINFRAELGEKYGEDFTNSAESKIGSKIFGNYIRSEGVVCDKYHQTWRQSTPLKDCIADYVKLKDPQFIKVKEYFESKSIKETKGVFKNLKATVGKVDFVFGLGGLHASVKNQQFFEDEEYMIQDSDVRSFYPRVSFLNSFFPEHLGMAFCKIYDELFIARISLEKESVENQVLKIALNGTFGNTICKTSEFYDPKCGMSITITGQLSLCMLTETLLKVPDLKIISANTDGICYKFKRKYALIVSQICKWWESICGGLELEHEQYSKVFARDVNNYIAVYANGKVKRKGCYGYGKDLVWNKDYSSQVVAKSAEAWLLNRREIKTFIKNHASVRDFIIHLKVPRSNLLYWGDELQPKIIRYVMCKSGKPLTKVMPAAGPLGEYKRANKLTDEYFDAVMQQIGLGVWDERIHTKNQSVYEERPSEINQGYKVALCTDLKDLENIDIDYEWYEDQVYKITDEFRNG